LGSWYSEKLAFLDTPLDGRGCLGSGALDLYKKTLNVADKLVHDPLNTMDAVAQLPKGVQDNKPKKKSYRDLQSRFEDGTVGKQSIFSMAGITFLHLPAMHNLRKLVLADFSSRDIPGVSWDFSKKTPVDTGTVQKAGRLLKWQTFFTSDRGEKEVLFVEDMSGVLSIFINKDAEAVVSIPDGGRFSSEMYKSIIRNLEK